ncbi:MAG: phytanoyl-CoA dioxygenase family protein [Candidatus Poribacteria bacterium]|jgi:ectoine hydroxylase-related dioxygenase (phytanoyl-CoA dioxygenase family)|nr:phytanoyl-CoA dioxygenase family protein [Candidatus Poribacteria bacterium]MDP6746895.1 phytanoyl-CoA dioxygenase family protein [Candidatus Poribacteria bacterium]MDP6998670.1 phytanoyl-CoA dioxygenase family protein [Candidatus Poribacteria bacterium]
MPSLLSIQQRQAFEAQGYLLVRQVLNAQVFDPIRSVTISAIDQYAQSLYNQGQISDLYKNLSFYKRLTQISRQSQTGPLLHWNWNRQVFGREIYQLITHAAILDIAASLLGSEITANGDYWLRFKMPTGDDSVFPWHQDSIYYNGNADPDQSVILSEQSQILTVWIPMVEVNEQNGCLQIIPGSHKRGLRPARRDENGRQVPVEDVESWAKVETVKMEVGDVCVFNNLTFHRSLANKSDEIRWSIDLRYSPTGSPLEWFHRKWPSFIARSQRRPETVESWEMWRAKRVISDLE